MTRSKALWRTTILYLPLAAFVVAAIAWALGNGILALIIILVIGLWELLRVLEENEHQVQAWENRYVNMTDSQKVDHHLERSRRLGTIHDAEIAQAIIQRNRRA